MNNPAKPTPLPFQQKNQSQTVIRDIQFPIFAPYDYHRVTYKDS